MTLTAVFKGGQWGVIRFLMVETVSGNEIHERMCMVYGTENVITKSNVNWWVQRFKKGQTTMSHEPWMTNFFQKEEPGMVCQG